MVDEILRPTTPRVDYDTLVRLGRELLVAIGEDPQREGIQDTPRRWADWWREYIEYEPGTTDTSFTSTRAGQLVCISGIRVWTLCEHHLLPFWCDVAIGYLVNETVLGLSKFARIAHHCAHRLQHQEQLGQHIADMVSQMVQTDDVAVCLRGEHLCMMMRGIKTPALITSTVMSGAFEREKELQSQFLHLVAPHF
ncbi:GTP cyclohydrolase I FolE [Ktedonosporobacter rubrisoli]|uniref:GTP cyclohydrolase I n=1 Tax=Ktedonosporobacter rubrisoli TaxID=2509675 RepID=A0A4V0YYN2_KTERU|nr:GTP cyclohydrolase I FolE [Ktedonosporobacter rubrisoli]QBD76811.1 GTP cyclohydrolase I FolE [Ktedonosporobacter rubrisoli]